MEYSNPKIPEGINTTNEHPLKEFFILSVGVLGLILIAVLILSLAAETLAVYVPFETEQSLIPEMWTQIEPEIESETSKQTREYMQSLSDRLAVHMHLFVLLDVRTLSGSAKGVRMDRSPALPAVVAS